MGRVAPLTDGHLAQKNKLADLSALERLTAT